MSGISGGRQLPADFDSMFSLSNTAGWVQVFTGADNAGGAWIASATGRAVALNEQVGLQLTDGLSGQLYYNPPIASSADGVAGFSLAGVYIPPGVGLQVLAQFGSKARVDVAYKLL